MAAKLRMAGPGDTGTALRLVVAAHEELGLAPDPDAREAALAALLSNEMPGAFYLIGPPTSPVGYLALSFGHSLHRGGTEAHLDEIWIRPPVRRRGMASEALHILVKTLGAHGVRALHIRVPETSEGLFRRLRFEAGSGMLLTRTL